MRLVRPLIATWLVTAACASGTENTGDDVDATVRTDAADTDAPAPDASAPDAQVPDAQEIDAASVDAAVPDAQVTDAMVTDAMVTDAAIDAGCTTMVLQRLTNPAFDLTPMGTGWMQTPYDAQSPLVTDEDGIVEHTAPYKAWLGGWPFVTNEVLFQDVTIPAGATLLTLRGQYAVGTDETGTGVYDTCNVELLTTGGALLQSVMSLSNRTSAAAWTPFQFTFSSPHGGQTVRLNFRSSTDLSLATAFWFDSLALEATVCQ
ncbi:MAG: hypothetical protein K8M05_37515 [Deltaproteobacteria bacterium]|nr:hypothetical protein [Kofleriaceae bacterium]